MSRGMDRTDGFTLLTFDMQMDFVFVSEFTECTGCCDTPTMARPNAIHAHLDHALRILYIVSDTRMFNTTLDNNIRHKQQLDYSPISLSGGTLLPEFFRQHDRRIVQISAASQLPFALYTQSIPNHDAAAFAREAQHWQSFYVMTESSTSSGMGLLRVLYGSERADAGYIVQGVDVTISPFDVTRSVTKERHLKYTPYFDNAHILQEVRSQIKKRHHKGAGSTTDEGLQAMRLHGFSVMNDRKRVLIPGNRAHIDQSDSVHLLLSHVQATTDILQQEDDTLHDQVLSLVKINVSFVGAVTLTVDLLNIVTHEPNDTPHSFFYSIIPFDVDATVPNNIVAKSIVAIMVQRGNIHTVHLSNFSCLQCGPDLYDADTDSCKCRAGTLPVCLPCSTNCATGRFIINPDPKMCHRADHRIASTVEGAVRRQRHNLVCMPCTGGFFCPNGTVEGIEQCPSVRPFTLQSRATANFQCVCPSGSAYTSSRGEEYAIHGASISRVLQVLTTNASTCDNCAASQVCSPKYTQSMHRILCPAHTSSSTVNVAAGEQPPVSWALSSSETSGDDSRHHNVYQGCFCVDGYYSTDQTTESYLLDSADFIYDFSWSNSVLEERRAKGNTRIHIRLEVCRQCEAGWVCRQSIRHRCSPLSSISTPGSTVCTCKTGYVKMDNTTCGPCPLDSICPGGTHPAVSCTAIAELARSDKQKYCPCETGRILNAVTEKCETCPADFYCPGFSNMTGVVPENTIYAQRCPPATTSVAGSQSLAACFCSKGFFVAHLGGPPACVPCDSGYYCPGFGDARIACPMQTTTSSSNLPAATVLDCVCLDPNMLLLPAQLHTQSELPSHICVCRPGWLQKRCVSKNVLYGGVRRLCVDFDTFFHPVLTVQASASGATDIQATAQT